MFAGLMSRCTTLQLWAAQRVRHLAGDLERAADGELAFPAETLPQVRPM
jgi:hypothetical protein